LPEDGDYKETAAMISIKRNLHVCIAAVATLLSGVSSGQAVAQHAIPVSGEVQGIHDPSMGKDGNTWYVFSTKTDLKAPGELPIHCSQDLQHWKSCGNVMEKKPDWIRKVSPKTNELWAPDISYFNGLYHLYYAYSAFGLNTSGIALLTNKTLNPRSPDYKWKDESLVLESEASDNFNAIDPNISFDSEGTPWLAFGSFWSGIKMRRIDQKTGKLSAEDTKLYALATRAKPAGAAPAKLGLPPDWQAIEAPFIVPHGGYYYLFVS
jgi:arabinan endo-1,5-alpha-L-arabinosidase